MTPIDFVIYTTGAFTLFLICLFCLFGLFELVKRGFNKITYRYYGKERINNLCEFWDWCRENRIQSVQKYANKNAITRWAVVVIALYLLRKV